MFASAVLAALAGAAGSWWSKLAVANPPAMPERLQASEAPETSAGGADRRANR